MRQLRYPVVWFFVFTYVLTAVGQSLHLYAVNRLSDGAAIKDSPLAAWMPYGFYLTMAGPSLVGLLMTVYLYGLPGVRRLAFQLTPWSVGRAWPVLAVCLFLPFMIEVLFFSTLAILDKATLPQSWSLSRYVFSAIISGGLIAAGICEEIGWRGFALPLLQRRYSAFVSSLIIGVAWALWHWPNYFIADHPNPFWGLVVAIPIGMAVAIVYTWAYNSTGGSLFAVVVLHGATVSRASVSSTSDPANAMIVPLLYVIIAIGLVWRCGTANVSWREKVIAEPPNTAN